MFAGGSKVNQWLQEWSGHEIENKAIVVCGDDALIDLGGELNE